MAEEEVATNVLEDTEDTGSNEETVDKRDFETEARDMGWMPKEDYKGPGGRWKPAEQFVLDGENILPIVNSQNKRLKKDLEAKDAEYTQRLSRLERSNNNAMAAQKKQFEAQIDDIKAQKLAAVEEGDAIAYKALDKKQDDLEKAQPAEEEQTTDNDVLTEWKAENTWFESNYEMNGEANRYADFLKSTKPRITLKGILKETDKQMRYKFPEEFGEKPKPKPKANGHAAVDGGGAFPGGGSRGGKSFNDLPAEARTACKQFVADGIMKQEDYVKDYFADEQQ